MCIECPGECAVSRLLFFSSRIRHTRCALVTGVQTCALPICVCRARLTASFTQSWIGASLVWHMRQMSPASTSCCRSTLPASSRTFTTPSPAIWKDRKRVVQGKSVSVRVDVGGRRIIKKQPHYPITEQHQHQRPTYLRT